MQTREQNSYYVTDNHTMTTKAKAYAKPKTNKLSFNEITKF